MGAVFARAYLRAGYPVYPVTREMDMGAAATVIAEPAVVLVAVAEVDLHKVLAHIPEPWRDRLGLLQNELLPRDWRAHGIQNPTVICVWFEKKKGQDVKVVLPSPVYGPGGERIKSALMGIGIPCRVLSSEAELLRDHPQESVHPHQQHRRLGGRRDGR